MKTFHSYSEVSACVGQEVAVTDWITITQEQVNLFAQATGTCQATCRVLKQPLAA